MSPRSALSGLLVGSTLVMADMESSEAKSTEKKADVYDEGELVKLKLVDFLAELENHETDASLTEQAVIFASRREFCSAVSDWTKNFMTKSVFNTPPYTGDNYSKPLPQGVGSGKLFDDVVAATITKGCLSAEERRAFFNDYKARILSFYISEIHRAIKTIKFYEADAIREKEYAVRVVKMAGLCIQEVEKRFDKEKSIKYEDLFEDDVKEIEIPHSKDVYYRKAVSLAKSLEKNGKISSGEALEKITKEMDAYWDLYQSKSVDTDTKADLLKGFLLLQDYQIKAMDEIIPRSGVIVSDTIIENGDTLAENQTEFDVTMKAEIKRSFKVPEMKFDEELVDFRKANSQNDSEWLRLAGYQYYGDAMYQFMTGLEIDTDDSIQRWEKSLALARDDFAGLPEYDSYIESLFSPTYRPNIYNQIIPAETIDYNWPLNSHSFVNDYSHLKLDFFPGNVICGLYSSAEDIKYDSCVDGMLKLRDHAIGNPSEDLTDVPAEFLRFIAREHVADSLDGNK